MTITGEQLALVGGVVAVLGVMWRVARWMATLDTRLLAIEIALGLVAVPPRARSQPPVTPPE